MKQFCKALFALCLCTTAAYSQYTDVINSNRPGTSYSAYSVGKNVLQFETGLHYKSYKHNSFNNSEVKAYGIDFLVRYGFFKENLEVVWDFTYQMDQLTNATLNPAMVGNRNGFLKNTIGARYLIYQPKERDVDIRSWKANNSFHWKDLIPAISVYAGANLNVFDTPYPFKNQFNLQNIPFYAMTEEPSISPKAMIATQSNFSPYWVFVMNFSYDKIATDYPEMAYILTLTHALEGNPRWSIFIEQQGIKSDIYADALVRGGAAYLLNKNMQVDLNIGGSIKNTPSQLSAAVGFSFRIDKHQDELINLEEGSGSKLDKKMKKKKKKKSKKGLKQVDEPQP